jgi:uncharacterized glyoxalase superfamily protein PhnB
METAIARVSRIAPEIAAHDLREPLAYYEQKLGFHVVSEMPEQKYVIVERDGIAIHLFGDSSHAHSPAGIHIFTDDLEDLYSELISRGAKITQPIVRKPWGNRDFRAADPFGNALKFTEPLAED